MNNPVFHDRPGNPLSPARMHREINDERHVGCVLDTCAMLSFCWTTLIDLGHAYPRDAPEHCLACKSGLA